MIDASAVSVVDAADDEAEADKMTRVVNVRCSSAQRQQMKAIAAQEGFSIGAYVRAFMLGTPGPRSRRRPSLDRELVGRLLGHIGHVGANLNQIARAVNIHGDIPAQSELARAAGDIAVLRAALMQALGRRTVSTITAPATVDQVPLLGHQG